MKLCFWRKDAPTELPDFDRRELPEIDEKELLKFVASTDRQERYFPLALALQVHDELEALMTSRQKLEAADLSEIRGGMKALKRFSRLYYGSALRERPKNNTPDFGEDE